MQTLPLIGGSYKARSVIANAQRCLNLFPELNRQDSPTPMTHYQRPGLSPLVVPGVSGLGRCVYQASNGDGYVVIGSTVYYVSSGWMLTALGSITPAITTPVSMIDNGDQLVIVDGTVPGAQATGFIDFTVNPSAGATATFNGVVFTFIAGATSGNNIHIDINVAFTINQNLLSAMQQSTDPLLTVADYTASADGGGGIKLNVGYNFPGAIGTTYTLAASAATPSGAALTLSANQIGGGWLVDLGDHTGTTYIPLVDVSWTGADRVDYIDTFVVWNQPGTNVFGSTLSNQIIPLDATYLAAKTGYPDPLQSIIVNKNEIMLPGSLKSEVWYNAGNALFPFARLNGAYIEQGLAAKYSIASADIDVFFIARDLQGRGMVLRKRGYEVTRISNHALEYAIQRMTDYSDAIGFTFQQDGHTFYVLSFPTGNQTWVWDESINDPMLGWSQWGWTGSDGMFNRTRGTLGANLYSKNVVIDWENGTIYEQSPTTYTDMVNAGTGVVEGPILFLRTFPHLMSGINVTTGQPMLAEGKMVQHERFQLNAEMGTNTSQAAAFFTIRYSDDRGASWGGVFKLSAGDLGKFISRPDARGLGQAMDRVYEVSWSFPGQVALNGAWVEGKILNQ